ncbi:MAG TPA: DnaJ domain-containing protein, partial [Microbacterium sp.]|uniref:J domain-containing protein n=1 Tax=Microbacterium sp. TaxID=51671 RepID=UPI002F9562C4
MFDSPLSASAYEVLAVDPAVDEETLRKAYRLRLRQTHPDTGGDAAVFIQVQRAWELVGTPDARAAYDRGHGFGEAAAPEWSGWRPPA